MTVRGAVLNGCAVVEALAQLHVATAVPALAALLIEHQLATLRLASTR